MNSNNQNDYSKFIPQEDQEGEGEKYSNFYSNLANPSQNQNKTEAEGHDPIFHNTENNSQKEKNVPDKISEKELKKESYALPLQSSLPTEEAKQPVNEQKPIETESNQQEIYDDLQNQINQNQQNTFGLMEIEEEVVVDSKEFGSNINITEAYTELNQNQSEINQENLNFDIYNESHNPGIHIPIQPWDKVSNMPSLFDNGYSDLYDDSDERFNFYGDYDKQSGVNG